MIGMHLVLSALLLADPASDVAHAQKEVWNSGLVNPRASVQNYLIASRASRYEEAARYLDLSEIPEAERAARGPLLARELKIVLDQRLWIDLESLSDHPDGVTDDGLTPDRDRVGVIETARGRFEINVMRRDGPDGQPRWRFSPGTLDRVQVLYSEIGYGRLLNWIPEWATRMRVGNVEGWQWVGLLLLAGLGVLVSRLLTAVLYSLLNRLNRRSDAEFKARILDTVRPPVRLSSALLVVIFGALFLRLSIPAVRSLGKVAIILIILLVSWTLMKLVDLATARTLERLQAQNRRSGVSTLMLVRRVAKGVVMALTGLVALQAFGVNVTGLLAGLGIAGAAIALAAQKTIENLFGGLVLTADEPIRIGDLCRFGDKQGIVEDIGLRSTRVRTLDRTVISVPNAELSSVQIENFALRDRIRLQTVLNLRYETTPLQMTGVLDGIRDLLRNDPRVGPDDLRVRFVAFGPYSLDVEIVAYILTDDFPTFLQVREELFLRIMEIVAAGGTGFAFPSQTLYMSKDQGLAAAPAATEIERSS